MVIPRVLSTIRDDLPSLKLSAEMPAELQATKHSLEKAYVAGSTEIFRLITQRGPTQQFKVLVIHILPPPMDVGQRQKSEPEQVPVDEGLIAEEWLMRAQTGTVCCLWL